MTPGPKTPKTYQIHRDNQRERILEVAQQLFIRNGIDGVNLSQIARAARMTRNTLYEYFPNKQEVAWAIFQKIVMHRQAVDAVQPQPEGSGFQRVERFMWRFAALLETHPEQLRFVVEFNSLYAREGSPARVRQIIEQGWPEGSGLLAQMVRQGIEDGSIRPDLDPGLLSAAIFNLLNGVNSRFSLLGGQISEEYGYPVMDMYREICRAFLRGIQSNPSSQETTR